MAAENKESYLLSRWLFLRALGLIHFVAFLSLSVQILMLNGKNGILPIVDALERVKEHYGNDAFSVLPTVFWLNASDQAILGACIVGIVLSLLATLGILTGPAFLLLAVLYTSYGNASGEFMAFQSDGLIVEATVLALFMVPWCVCEKPLMSPAASVKQPSKLALVLMRFLLFRLMFAAGLVKLLSGDPTWHDLTALSYHHETQPIPTPLAWFLHHMPMVVHQSAVIFTFVVELLIPFFYFAGTRLRLIGACATAALHLGILLSGNYTFLNFLSIALCIPLIDDHWFEKLIPLSLRKQLQASLSGTGETPLPQASPGTEETPLQPNSLPGTQESPLQQARAPRIRFGDLAYTLSAVSFLVLGASQFLLGLGGVGLLPPFLRTALMVFSPYRVFNSYGMFAVMTTSRPEIVFEGSADGKEWKPYTFKYKVDDPNKAPPVVAPHMPRLDWRLWFASMRNISESPWVLNIAQLLLKGQPALLSAFKTNPFPDQAPRYIRAYVYDYHFSDWDALRQKGEWWRRDNKRLYLPPVMLDGDNEIVPARLDFEDTGDSIGD